MRERAREKERKGTERANNLLSNTSHWPRLFSRVLSGLVIGPVHLFDDVRYQEFRGRHIQEHVIRSSSVQCPGCVGARAGIRS